MSDSRCFLTDKTDCKLTDVHVNGSVYWVDEEIADEYPFKKLKEMIADKIEESNKKKDEAINQIKMAAESLGISKEDLGRLLLGQKSEPESTPAATTPPSTAAAPTPPTPPAPKKDDFVEVEGDLPTRAKVRANVEDDMPGTMPAHSSFTDKEGKIVREEGKKVKRLEDGIVEISNMGTTVIRMDHQSGSVVDKMLRTVDENGNLVRATMFEKRSGARTVDCNLCNGSGITRVGYQKCPKCGGVGIVTV